MRLPYKWQFPNWMEPFLGSIVGVDNKKNVEWHMNYSRTTAYDHAPREIMNVNVKAQVHLLERLHEGKKLV